MVRRTPADLAIALERRAARRLICAVARVAERLADRESPGRLRHALRWRLREWISQVRPITVHRGAGRPTEGRQLLLVSNDLSRSGAPQLVVEMAQLLTEGGASVTVVSPTDGPQRAVLTEAGVTVIIAASIEQTGSTLIGKFIPILDAAICNTIATAPAVATLAQAVPTIWYVHEVSLLEEMLAADTSLDRTLRSPARVWAGSELPAALLRPYRPDVAVVPYGINRLATDDIPVRIIATDRPLRLVVLASIETRKGQDLLLDALAMLPSDIKEQLQVTIHGRVLEPDFGDALRDRAAMLANVTIRGALDRDGYRAAMLAADAIVIPSRDDTLPLTSLDALGSGRVLICTATTGTAHYLTSGVDGFIAAAPTAAAIATTLIQAVGRAGDWPAIAAAGQVMFVDCFSRGAFAARINAELDAITSSGVRA